MARLERLIKICDRCVGRQVIAVESVPFVVDGKRYRIELCDDHLRMFHLGMAEWSQLAECDPLPDLPTAFDPPPAAAPPSVARIAVPTPPVVAPRVEIVEEPTPAPLPFDIPDDVSGISFETASRWSFTRTAEDRMDELGLHQVDVWRVLDARGKTITLGLQPDTRAYTFRGVTVIVNPDDCTVITVKREDSARPCRPAPGRRVSA